MRQLDEDEKGVTTVDTLGGVVGNWVVAVGLVATRRASFLMLYATRLNGITAPPVRSLSR
ncbi:MAG: hypothetical protein RLZZ612_645 [Pseudomonadota bacterium]